MIAKCQMRVNVVNAVLFQLFDDSGNHIGAAISTPFENGVFISMVYIVPESRRQGGATELMRDILRFYRDTVVWLEPKAWGDADRSCNNKALREWYSRLGFENYPLDKRLMVRVPNTRVDLKKNDTAPSQGN